MSKHSPGPWRVHQARPGWGPFSIEDANGLLVGNMDAKADARLVAAAPELLEALRWYVERHGQSPDLFGGVNPEHRAIIARIDGKEGK